MPYEQVGELLDCLEPPLQIARPNKFKIVHMDIPIVRFTNPKTGSKPKLQKIFKNIFVVILQEKLKITWSSALIFWMLSLKTSLPGKATQLKNLCMWRRSR